MGITKQELIQYCLNSTDFTLSASPVYADGDALYALVHIPGTTRYIKFFRNQQNRMMHSASKHITMDKSKIAFVIDPLDLCHEAICYAIENQKIIKIIGLSSYTKPSSKIEFEQIESIEEIEISEKNLSDEKEDCKITVYNEFANVNCNRVGEFVNPNFKEKSIGVYEGYVRQLIIPDCQERIFVAFFKNNCKA